MRNVVKGFQVKQEDGSYIFVAENEIYSDSKSDLSELEQNLISNWIKLTKSKRKDERKPIPYGRIGLNLSLIIILIIGVSLNIERFGLIYGLLINASIIVVLYFLHWCLTID
jgi:hypothetical protein